MQNPTAPASKQAPILALPRELRLQICQEVFSSDQATTVIDFWEDTHSAEHGFKSVPIFTKTSPRIPWLNLMLTCREFALDLRSTMSGNSFLAHEENTTYCLDLEATRGGRILGPATWRRLPCPPHQVSILEARYNASKGFQPWGDGGPHRITRGLFQILNHLIHCGPRFDSRHQLPKPMHVRELRIFIESGEGVDPEAMLAESETNPETTMYALGSIVGQIVRTGILRGHVDKIRITTGDKELSWKLQEFVGAGIPGLWDQYGFVWGMSLYQVPAPIGANYPSLS